MSAYCRNGHAYTDSNSYWSNGLRQCRQCRHDARIRYEQGRRREERDDADPAIVAGSAELRDRVLAYIAKHHPHRHRAGPQSAHHGGEA